MQVEISKYDEIMLINPKPVNKNIHTRSIFNHVNKCKEVKKNLRRLPKAGHVF